MNTQEQEEIVNYALGFCPLRPHAIDWDDLFYRIEVAFDIDLGNDMLGEDIVRLKEAISSARRDSCA